jgi:putative aldouronate transport system substrate-binding protein
MLWTSDVVTDEWLDVIEDFLRDVKEAGELRLGIHVPWFEEQGYEIFANPYAFRISDPEMTVINIWDTPRHRATLDRLAHWYREGYIRQDILSVQNLAQDDFRPDGHIMWMDQEFRGSVAARSADRGFEMIAFPFEPHYWIPAGRTPTNFTVPRTARYPERSVQLLELLNTRRGSELYNMLVYGLEDVHWTRVGDNRIETLHYVGAATGDSPYGLPKWALGNTFNAYLTQAEEDGWNEYIENVVHGEAQVSPIMGFVADRTPVEDEYSLVDAIRREYTRLYALPDYEEVYAEYMEKLRVAGNDRIIAEFQQQLDEFRRQNR